MTNQSKGKFVNFRATQAQWQRIEELCEATGQKPAEVLRSLVDSATLARVVVSTYSDAPHTQRGELVQHVS